MPLITVTRKPSVLQGFQLTTSADMQVALEYLSTRGYLGSISSQRVSNTVTWMLTLYSDSGTGAQSAGINDWLVIENDAIATLLTAEDAAALYQAA